MNAQETAAATRHILRDMEDLHANAIAQYDAILHGHVREEVTSAIALSDFYRNICDTLNAGLDIYKSNCSRSLDEQDALSYRIALPVIQYVASVYTPYRYLFHVSVIGDAMRAGYRPLFEAVTAVAHRIENDLVQHPVFFFGQETTDAGAKPV